MFQRLVNYKEKYGDCLVPRRFKEDPKLASWVKTQRVAYKKNNLSKEKIEALEEIGFVWSLR